MVEKKITKIQWTRKAQKRLKDIKTYYKERKVFKKSKRRLTGINAETSLRKPKRLEATHEKEYGYKVPKEAANRKRKD